MSIYRRALAYYRPFLRASVAAVLLTLVSIALGLLRPWPFAFIVDHVLPKDQANTLVFSNPGITATPKAEKEFVVTIAPDVAAGKYDTRLEAKSDAPGSKFDLAVLGYDLSTWSRPAIVALMCSLIVVFHLISGVLNLVSGVLFLRVGLQALLRLRTELYAYLHSLPLKFHDQRRSADSSFRVAYDSQSIQSFYSKAVFIYQSTFSIASTFALMWGLDWKLSLLSLAVVPFMVAVMYFFARRIRTESTTIAERESAVLTVAQEGLSSIKMVQAFGREDFEVAQFRASAADSLHANMRLNFVSMKSALVVGTLIAISTAVMYYAGSTHVLAGTLSLGQLIWMSSLLLLLYQPLEALTNVAWALEGAAAGAKRCFEVLDRADDVPDAPDAKTLDTALGEVVFEKVTFEYDEGRPIFSDVNLRLSPGETVAFVGNTGAGKSTLLSLVPRFYDPNAGRILLDGHDIRSITKKSLRSHISIVLQDTLLFSTTVRENIAYGRPDATEEQIIEAAKRAQAHDFISKMPDGYRSQVGERGGHLSVGQRQRIGIARAFLKDAPILILDEPTSALDPTTEAAIMVTLEELMRGRTTLIITHRIATIHGVDKIVVLADGTIAEQGRGPDLVAANGVYAGLYRSANLGQ